MYDIIAQISLPELIKLHLTNWCRRVCPEKFRTKDRHPPSNSLPHNDTNVDGEGYIADTECYKEGYYHTSQIVLDPPHELSTHIPRLGLEEEGA